MYIFFNFIYIKKFIDNKIYNSLATLAFRGDRRRLGVGIRKSF